MWQKTFASGAMAVAAFALIATASASDPIRTLTVDVQGPLKDPEAAFWADAPLTRVTMNPQVVTLPRHADIAVNEMTVRAAHNGRWIGVLVEWRDEARQDMLHPDSFGDQVAIQFPVQSPASPMMGNTGGLVNIIQWRAAFQRDLAEGQPTIRDLYPFALVDVYPDEVLNLTDARAYTGAIGVDNPVSRPFDSPVLDQVAEGWGSLTVKPVQQADGWGVWHDGTWRVAITRPMTRQNPGDPDLLPGSETVIAFAVWDGANNEVGARKSWSSWIPLRIGE
ncbi:ethylbenzene dehydrogenase-related protein [Thioalkalivibrio sulfidiphilus]|uniref:ethylbenzene dehydrogenase-related protein n=1 Tax=Thioalkalivibrio sulfidiphilus TaxID=1033854 RepID=UPI003B38472E